MAFTRWSEDRSKPVRATAGDVFVALSRDAEMSEVLHEIYRKLFEGQKLQTGADLHTQYMPDHYLLTEPKKARAEINEVAAWIRKQFGDPVDRPPKTTPFTYNSYGCDAWVALFAMLLHGDDQGIKQNFMSSVEGMSWGGYRSSRATGFGGEGVAGAPSASAPASWTDRFLGAPRMRGRAAPASSGQVIVTPSPSGEGEKPGIIERIFGVVKPKVEEPAVEVEEELAQEVEAGRSFTFTRQAEAEAARRIILRQIVKEELAARAREQKRLPSSGPTMEEWVEINKSLPQFGRFNKPAPKALKIVEDENAIEGARVKALLEEQERLRAIEREAAEAGKSTREKLQRPGGSTGGFGG